jgi:Ca2+-binding EF-hand superfamily protein
MGQKFGKASIVASVEPFTNLSRRAISLIWQVFNDIADGFGITKDELKEICAELKNELNISNLLMIEKAELLFHAFDTDENTLIDALEFTSTIAALSGMKLQEILEFVLTSYDFDGTQMLSIVSLIYSLKT